MDSEVTVAIRPLRDRVLIRRMSDEGKTAGGLYIPDTAKEKPQKGEVISVGKGPMNKDGVVLKMDVKAGDKVLFSKYAGTEISINGESFLLMREDDILGVFTE